MADECRITSVSVGRSTESPGIVATQQEEGGQRPAPSASTGADPALIRPGVAHKLASPAYRARVSGILDGVALVAGWGPDHVFDLWIPVAAFPCPPHVGDVVSVRVEVLP